MKLQGTLTLTLIALLERFSFYGIRGVMILFAMDPNAINISEYYALDFYGTWTSLLIIISVPFGYIIDRFFGQRKSIYIGGLLSLIGYSILTLQNNVLTILSLVLFLFGTSLVKPSATILIGRQFKKEDRTRTLSFIIFFGGINFGAFLGILILGYIANNYGWNFGFIASAVATITYLSIMVSFNSCVIELESNYISSTDSNVSLIKSLKLISLILIISVVFWNSFNLESTRFITSIMPLIDSTLLDFKITENMYYDLIAIWAIPITVIVFGYWYIKGVTKTFETIITALIILLLAILLGTTNLTFKGNYLNELVIFVITLYAISEALISPIITSYVTRVSDIKYSNTIYASFTFISHILGLCIIFALKHEYQTISVITILSIISLGLFGYRRYLNKIANGIY